MEPKVHHEGEDDGVVHVSLLDGGSFSTAALKFLHADAGDTQQFRMYNWCFHIHHPSSGRHVLWDLGCSHVCSQSYFCTPLADTLTDDRRQDHTLYTPWVLKNQVPYAGAVGPSVPVVNQLLELGVHADDVDSVIFRCLDELHFWHNLVPIY